MRLIAILLAMALLPCFALAEEVTEEIEPSKQETTPTTYSPDFCEFSVTFPGEPYTTRKCDQADNSKCYDQISYTQVYGLSSTVNFRLICNKIGQDVIKNYSGEIMEATLKAMTKDTVVKTFDTSFREEKGYKQAGLVGEGKTGTLPTIYIAQLWIGSQSALSVEAELIGQPDDTADKLFSNVLKSVEYTGVKSEASAEEKKEEEKPAEEKKPEEPEATPSAKINP